MSRNGVLWTAAWLVLAVGRNPAEEPWRAVEQPELKAALERAPTLQAESLGAPARGVKVWERGLVPNPEGKTWDVLQIYATPPRKTWSTDLFVYDPGTNTVEERGEIVPGLGGYDGPDDFMWTYLRNVLVRIDPKDARVHVVGRVDPVGWPTFVGNDVYFSGPEPLRRIRTLVEHASGAVPPGAGPRFEQVVLDDSYIAYERDVGDMDGDGRNDVAAVMEGDTTVQVFHAPTWKRSTLIPFTGEHRYPRADDFKLADMDSDGIWTWSHGWAKDLRTMVPASVFGARTPAAVPSLFST